MGKMVQIFEAVDEGLKYYQSIESLVKQREKRFYFFLFHNYKLELRLYRDYLRFLRIVLF